MRKKIVNFFIILLVIALILIPSNYLRANERLDNIHLRIKGEWDIRLTSENVDIKLIDEKGKWEVLEDGSFRYKFALKPNEKIELTVKVSFSEESDNNYQGASFRLKLQWLDRKVMEQMRIIGESPIIEGTGSYKNWNPGDSNMVTWHFQYKHLPNTGQSPPIGFYGIGFTLIIVGITLLKLKKGNIKG